MYIYIYTIYHIPYRYVSDGVHAITIVIETPAPRNKESQRRLVEQFLVFIYRIIINTKSVFFQFVRTPRREILQHRGWGWGGGKLGTNICSVHRQIFDFYELSNDILIFFGFLMKTIENNQHFFFQFLRPPGRRLLTHCG